MIRLTTEQAQQIEEALAKIAFEAPSPVTVEALAAIAFDALPLIRAARVQEQDLEPVAIVDEIGLCVDGTHIFIAIGKVEVGMIEAYQLGRAERKWVDLTDDELGAAMMPIEPTGKDYFPTPWPCSHYRF